MVKFQTQHISTPCHVSNIISFDSSYASVIDVKPIPILSIQCQEFRVNSKY